jgi:plastocyanin domain-containing protein
VKRFASIGARAALAACAAVIVALAVAGCGGAGGGAKGASQVQTVAVKVTPDGFVPAELAVAQGKPIRLVMTRETDQTCARQVVFASLNLKKDLPLNEPVTIDLPAQPAGRLAYACGMDMVHGALVVQ